MYQPDVHLCSECGWILGLSDLFGWWAVWCGYTECPIYFALTPPVLPSGDLKSWQKSRVQPKLDPNEIAS